MLGILSARVVLGGMSKVVQCDKHGRCLRGGGQAFTLVRSESHLDDVSRGGQDQACPADGGARGGDHHVDFECQSITKEVL